MRTITPHYRSIQQLLGSRTFAIDEYQREYQWDRENIEELLSDLVDKFQASYQEGHETSRVAGYEGYYLGAIIVSDREGKSYLVDGQQRVTSLTLLLIHLHHLAKDRGHSVAASVAPLIYSDNLGTPSFNLDIPERLPAIKALFHREAFSPDGKEESIQTMLARYGDIEMRDLAEELAGGLAHFMYWLMTRVGLIEIVTDSDNYAYAIFETMNDRGKPLSPVDMLKAYVLAPVLDPAERHAANQIWKAQVLRLITWGGENDQERDDQCIKAWFRAQHAQSTRERRAGATDRDWELIGSEFHRWARDHRDRIGLGAPNQNLQFIQRDFPFYADAFLRIRAASHTYTTGLESIYYNAHNEFTWQDTVLLAALEPSDNAETIRQKFAVVATYLDIWLVRRAVNYIRVGYSPASYAMYLLCTDIRRRPVADLVDVLERRLADDDVQLGGSPSRDRLGIADLRNNQFSRRHLFHILARITSTLEVRSGQHDRFPDFVDRSHKNPFDIEHLLPARPDLYTREFPSEDSFTRVRDSVASLVLLPADVNRSFQDKRYEDKLAGYVGQNLYAASLAVGAYANKPQFAAFRKTMQSPPEPLANFGPEEHRRRMATVSELIHVIWSPSRLREAAR
ncbi:MAG: DUF262 domain-containing protein [Chloroflexota bacterium]|nr:MAG: DUF262 domain-containing protein [Chloroflexota bacterium]